MASLDSGDACAMCMELNVDLNGFTGQLWHYELNRLHIGHVLRSKFKINNSNLL